MLVVAKDGLANEGIQSANGWMNERGRSSLLLPYLRGSTEILSILSTTMLWNLI